MAQHHHVFARLIAACEALEPIKTAVVYPLSDVALLGAVEAAEEALIDPVLVGPRAEIERVAAGLKRDVSRYRIVEAETDLEAAVRGVALCRDGSCEALMKGSLHTDHFMHAVVAEGTGLRTHRRVSHVFIFDVPAYRHTLLVSDAAINIYPTLEDKVDIVQNAIDLAQTLGIATPKVAVLSAVETVTPKIVSTIDAAALCKMAERDQITGGIVDGPLAFDNAINLKAAEIKHLHSKVAGRAEVLVVPDLEAGNMLAKQLEYFADAQAAGIVVGARVPLILTSRSDNARTRLASSAVAALMAHARRRNTAAAVPA
jgi:phosphate acetyltransferase